MADFSELLAASRFFLRLELNVGGGNDTVDATFLECQRFERSQPITEIVEVTPNQWAEAKYGQMVTTKIPGRAKTENIVLKRGMTNSMTLWNWFNLVESGKWSEHVAEGSLSIYDQAGSEQARYDFRGAWPTRYKTADVNAQSTELAIEELELAVDNFVRVS
jgi:phage tail-like protein